MPSDQGVQAVPPEDGNGEEAEERAEREAGKGDRPVAQKKARGRSENLDPEIEA